MDSWQSIDNRREQRLKSKLLLVMRAVYQHYDLPAPTAQDYYAPSLRYLDDEDEPVCILNLREGKGFIKSTHFMINLDLMRIRNDFENKEYLWLRDAPGLAAEIQSHLREFRSALIQCYEERKVEQLASQLDSMQLSSREERQIPLSRLTADRFENHRTSVRTRTAPEVWPQGQWVPVVQVRVRREVENRGVFVDLGWCSHMWNS